MLSMMNFTPSSVCHSLGPQLRGAAFWSVLLCAAVLAHAPFQHKSLGDCYVNGTPERGTWYSSRVDLNTTNAHYLNILGSVISVRRPLCTSFWLSTKPRKLLFIASVNHHDLREYALPKDNSYWQRIFHEWLIMALGTTGSIDSHRLICHL